MSRRVGKPTICICENKGADQLRSNCEADQRLCFRCTDSTDVQAGLCRTCSETTLWFSHELAHMYLAFAVIIATVTGKSDTSAEPFYTIKLQGSTVRCELYFSNDKPKINKHFDTPPDQVLTFCLLI